MMQAKIIFHIFRYVICAYKGGDGESKGSEHIINTANVLNEGDADV